MLEEEDEFNDDESDDADELEEDESDELEELKSSIDSTRNRPFSATGPGNWSSPVWKLRS